MRIAGFRYHFCLFNLEYLPSQRTEFRSKAETNDEPASRELTLKPSKERLGVNVTYIKGTRHFELTKEFFTVDQIVLDFEGRFKRREFEQRHFDFGDGIVAEDRPGAEEIEAVLRKAMTRAGINGDRLSVDNRQQIDLFFNQFLPKGTKKVVREQIEGRVTGLSTTMMQQASARAGGLDHATSVFVSEDLATELDEQNSFVLGEIAKQPKQPVLPACTRPHIRELHPPKYLYAVNTSLFRTPHNLVILSHEPEREFVFRLIEHTKYIKAWVKSPDMGFYSLDYEFWKRGKDRVRRSFNPDFFIHIAIADFLLLSKNAQDGAVDRLRHLQERGIETIILVVEIKSDDDDSDATKAKEQAGKAHFSNLNSRLRELNPIDVPEEFRNAVIKQQRYIFSLLRPLHFGSWFAQLANGMFIWDLGIERWESSPDSNSAPRSS